MISKAHWQGGRVRLPLVSLVCCILVCSITLGASADWWNDVIFYEIFVRSFSDSDGDGIGDLQGLIEKLDYLNDGDPTTDDDLGVTALWLMPIMPSPSYHGYDVTDYYGIEPDYGTMSDFQNLLSEAHARGIRIIIDLVLNHTSSAHPWFQSSRESSSSYRDWYIWSDGLPGYTGPWGQRVWHFGGVGYYYGLFWSEMPDLNYSNAEVTLQMLDIVRFWLDEVGVDGFRLDAIRHLIEDGKQQLNTAATHSWLYGFRTVAKGWNNDAFLLGEVWDSPEAVIPYLDNQLDMCFEFELADAILNGVVNSRVSSIENALRKILSVYPSGQYASFLSNHDQERVMTRLFANEEKAKLAASILLTLPGTPFIYYGEEIGMTGTKPDELIRTPMQWSDAEAGGFTSGIPWEPFSDDRFGRSVATQSDTANSLLSTYRRLIQLRAESLVLGAGDLIIVDTGHPSILSYFRVEDDALVWILHNLSAFGARPSTAISETQMLLDTNSTYFAIDLLEGMDSFSFRVTAGGNLEGAIPALAPYQTVILELRPL